MARHWNTHVDQRDEIIRSLKDELWLVRYNLLRTLPDDLYGLLDGYRNCETRKEFYDWVDHVAVAIGDLAKPLPESLHGWGAPRALCPLCRGGSDSYYDRGFAIPEGLRRHLVGYGNTRKCVFMETAEKLALASCGDRFWEVEREEELEKMARVEQRISSETTYRIDPFQSPRLIDDGIFYGRGARTEDELEFAKERLKLLGLKEYVEGKVEAWVDEREDWILYADLRQSGRINFSVWKKPLPKRPPSQTYKYRIGSFFLLDSWKNDLQKKYESRLP